MKRKLCLNPGEKEEKVDISNSFLIETSFNSDIDIQTRANIERKFKNSKANLNYVFPRKKNRKRSKNKSSDLQLGPDDFTIGPETSKPKKFLSQKFNGKKYSNILSPRKKKPRFSFRFF